MKYFKYIIVFLLLITLSSCKNGDTKDIELDTPNTSIKGVWWWNKKLDDKYLDFAYSNNVNEIYYCDSNLNDATTNFIDKCTDKNISCYLLAGEYEWIEDDTKLLNLIDRYLVYNKFCGIHLDIEPHQHPNFKENREELITKYISLIYKLNTLYPNIDISYDIPFWLHDIITFNNETKEAYKFIIDYATKTFIMSYRDTFDAVMNVAKEELEYAKNNNKKLILSLETYSTEGDFVSFYEEGKKMLNEVIKKIENESLGVSIHHIKTWYDLKE